MFWDFTVHVGFFIYNIRRFEHFLHIDSMQMLIPYHLEIEQLQGLTPANHPTLTTYRECSCKPWFQPPQVFPHHPISTLPPVAAGFTTLMLTYKVQNGPAATYFMAFITSCFAQ